MLSVLHGAKKRQNYKHNLVGETTKKSRARAIREKRQREKEHDEPERMEKVKEKKHAGFGHKRLRC